MHERHIHLANVSYFCFFRLFICDRNLKNSKEHRPNTVLLISSKSEIPPHFFCLRYTVTKGLCIPSQLFFFVRKRLKLKVILSTLFLPSIGKEEIELKMPAN